MSSPPPSPSESFPIVFARKLALFVLLVVVTALVLVILLLQVRWPITFLTFILIDLITGLFAGASVRWILSRKRNRVLQIALILAFSAAILVLLGWLTGWRFGINPLRINPVKFDWWPFGQILLCTFSGLLILYAWRRTVVVVPQVPLKVPPKVPVPSAAPSAALPVGKTAHPPKKAAPRKSPPPKKRPQKRRPVRAVPAARHSPAVREPVRAARAPAAVRPTAVRPAKAKRKALFRRKSFLQLSPEEEHRCPYCLELVEPNDPRGVVECKTCHTLHHADCWAITGACQVPHYVN